MIYKGFVYSFYLATFFFWSYIEQSQSWNRKESMVKSIATRSLGNHGIGIYQNHSHILVFKMTIQWLFLHVFSIDELKFWDQCICFEVSLGKLNFWLTDTETDQQNRYSSAVLLRISEMPNDYLPLAWPNSIVIKFYMEDWKSRNGPCSFYVTKIKAACFNVDMFSRWMGK